MSADTSTPVHDAAHAAPGGHAATHHYDYVKIWGILLVLLVLSVAGPIVAGNFSPTVKLVMTLITAFGIAFVKAGIVIKYFMHLTVEKKYIGWLMLTMIAFMIVFFGGTSPDVMKHEGQRWTNTAAQDTVTKGLAEDAAKGGGHQEKH